MQQETWCRLQHEMLRLSSRQQLIIVMKHIDKDQVYGWKLCESRSALKFERSFRHCDNLYYLPSQFNAEFKCCRSLLHGVFLSTVIKLNLFWSLTSVEHNLRKSSFQKWGSKFMESTEIPTEGVLSVVKKESILTLIWETER